jgi:large subunit ribosomal protein L31
MKEGIHPNYNVIEVSCACGNKFQTRSTAARIHMEVCNACHPFYTGRQKLLDTAGRVERFQKRYAQTSGKTVERKPATKAAAKVVNMKKIREIEKTPLPAPTLKERSPRDGAPRSGAPRSAAPRGEKPAAKSAPKAPAK